VTNYPLQTVFSTLIPLLRVLWPMVGSALPSCCSHKTAAAQLAVNMLHQCGHSLVETGTTSEISTVMAGRDRTV